MSESNKRKDRSMFPVISAVSFGFIIAICISILSLTMLARENTKEVDTMLTYRIYDYISSSINEPIIVAQTMSCDDFLAGFLLNEDSMDEEEAINVMQNYLSGVRSSLEYDSAFLVSENSRRYYTYEGLNKVIDPENDDHDIWYSLFVDQDVPYDLDVDSDEVNRGVWTIFVNARIEDEDGNLLGVCGVGVQMTNIQDLFRECEQLYGVKINLVDPDGLVQVDTDDINIENAWLDADVLSHSNDEDYVYQTTGNNEFAVTKYVQYLGWYLVVRSAPTTINREFIDIIVLNIVMFLVVMVLLILMITIILRRIRKERDDREKLLILSERAVAASEAKSTFLSSMSHEIRTPINAVLGMNEMILRHTDDDTILNYSTSIKNAGQTLLSLVNSILDFSKIEEGKMEIVAVTYDTAALINNILASVTQRAESKGLEFITEIDGSLPSSMTGDDVRLQQIIVNILTNAVKYTEKGHVHFTFRGENRDGDNIDIYVAVEDTGIGIREEDMPKLFESFERLDKEKNHNIEGTGLGMAIVTNLLRMMGSEIHVKSTYGEGSVFYFTVRQKIADETPMGDYTRALSTSKSRAELMLPHGEKARVLVVDDNEMNLKVADNLLALFGIKAELTSSGYDALELVKSSHYDLILLDHMMPKLDGKETLDRMRKEHLIDGSTKVVALTANAINGAKDDYLSSGFDGYLSKPVEIDALEAVLKTWLPDEVLNLSEDDVLEFEPQTASEDVSADNMNSFISKLKENGFDTDMALSFCAGDVDFYKELLGDYAEGFEERKSELDDSLKAHDLHEFEIKIHALKSASKTIGAVKLSEDAYELEKAASREDEAFINDYYGMFTGDYAKAVSDIKEAL